LAIKDRLTRPSSWVTSFLLPHDNLGVGDKGFDQVVIQLHQLTGHITPVCDRYVQYLLAGANSSVLNRHMRRLQPWRCWLTTYHSPTFPTDRRRRPEGGEWESIKIPSRNSAYVPKLAQRPSLLTWPRPHSYIKVVGPRNRVRNLNGNTRRCWHERVRDW
jgi:hypothetical protein